MRARVSLERASVDVFACCVGSIIRHESSYHYLTAPTGGFGGGGGGRDVRPGDWECPSCQAHVFASKTHCFRCNTPKPVRACARVCVCARAYVCFLCACLSVCVWEIQRNRETVREVANVMSTCRMRRRFSRCSRTSRSSSVAVVFTHPPPFSRTLHMYLLSHQSTHPRIRPPSQPLNLSGRCG